MRKTCKKCGGKVIYKKFSKFIYSFGYLMMCGLCMWIPIFGWILAPIFFLASIILLFFPRMYVGTCKDCGEVVFLTKKEYERMMK